MENGNAASFGDSPEVMATAKELIRQFPHLDYLMASTIAWHELEKNSSSKDSNAGFKIEEVVSRLDTPQSTP